MGKNIKISDGPKRKRGRPAGSNRTPLTSEERRARNAQYERERRAEYNYAIFDLAEAVGCDPGMSHTNLLAKVLCMLSNAQISPESVDSLRLSNASLTQQIQDLEARIGPDPTLSSVMEGSEKASSVRTNTSSGARQKIKAANRTVFCRIDSTDRAFRPPPPVTQSAEVTVHHAETESADSSETGSLPYIPPSWFGEENDIMLFQPIDEAILDEMGQWATDYSSSTLPSRAHVSLPKVWDSCIPRYGKVKHYNNDTNTTSLR